MISHYCFYMYFVIHTSIIIISYLPSTSTVSVVVQLKLPALLLTVQFSITTSIIDGKVSNKDCIIVYCSASWKHVPLLVSLLQLYCKSGSPSDVQYSSSVSPYRYFVMP